MTTAAIPKVSVVIPTHHRRENLPRVIGPLLLDESVLEVVVVVDGSRDGSLELCQQMADDDPRVRPISTEQQGGAAARQRGIDAACGDVVLLLDDDVVPLAALASGHARRHTTADDLVVVGYMPTQLSEDAAPERFAPRLYAQEYEGVCRAYERELSSVLLRLWGGNVSVRRKSLGRVP